MISFLFTIQNDRFQYFLLPQAERRTSVVKKEEKVKELNEDKVKEPKEPKEEKVKEEKAKEEKVK